MLSLTPYYRAQRQCLVIRVILHGVVVKSLATGIRISPEQWHEAKRVVINHANQKVLNQKLQKQTADLQYELTRAELLGVNLTPDRVKKLAEGKAITTDFYQWAESYIRDRYSKASTLAQMNTEIAKLKRFQASLQFGDIDARFCLRYESYMRTKLNNQGNTPWKSMKFLRNASPLGNVLDRKVVILVAEARTEIIPVSVQDRLHRPPHRDHHHLARLSGFDLERELSTC